VSSGTLYLLPTPLADGTALEVLPAATLATARRIELFFAENAKSARAFLKSAGHPRPLQELQIVEIGHRPDRAAIDGWLQPVRAGRDAAIVSEAGCPGIADPGAEIVAHAHRLDLPVVPLVGPSSILLAIMGCGLNGQAFRFLGYLPQDGAELEIRLREVEQASRQGETQVWIETPYRNDRMLASVLATCAPDTLLTLATDLTGADASVQTRTVAAWQSVSPAVKARHKRPTVFALLAGPRHQVRSRGKAST
jgi:16S rRNA (cytidine1402-2'-O)-methyltransferase